ncbi:MAG TPA: Gfo/Idh/MocA family oxidoreductase [Planctomycetaceae bacterium]|nr:Gfo/Idh/MocA family oxidoreductase [Planctomycetaceae bacterium]
MIEYRRREFIQHMGGAAATAVSASLAPRLFADEPPAARTIRIGQIGVGHAHASKLHVYRQSADYEVVGIVEPDPELRARARSQDAYRDLPWMTEEQLLNSPGLEAVLVETRVADLLDVAERCVAAGKHIHLDKPAGESLPHFRRILEAAKRQKRLVQMGYMYRYNPAIVLLRQFLDRGWLGQPFELHAVMSKVVPPETRRQLAGFAGGIMFELGCHLIDLVVGLLGPPLQVTAFPQQASNSDDGLLDNMLAVFEYPQAIATVKSSALEVEGFARRHLVVCGDEGTFHIQPLDDPSARVALSRRRGEYHAGYQDVRFPKYTRYVADAADMAQIIRGEKVGDFPYEHDLAVQETLLKACGREQA